MGVSNYQPLAKSKGVHCEAEFEGSLRQNPEVGKLNGRKTILFSVLD
jgi:hypothetical protein